MTNNLNLNPGMAGNSLNLYSYADNSPLAVKDPSGKILPLALVPVVAAAAGRGALVGVGAYIGSTVLAGGDLSLGGRATFDIYVADCIIPRFLSCMAFTHHQHWDMGRHCIYW